MTSDPDPAPEPEELPPAEEHAGAPSPVTTARRRYGLAGAVVAGGMVAIENLLRNKPREEPAVIVESNSDPEDIDRDGITVPVDQDTSVHSPPPGARPTARRTVRRTRRP